MAETWYNEEKVAFKGSTVLTEWNQKRQEEKAASTTDDLYKELFARGTVKSGATVNAKTAFYVSVVYRCAALKADGLAMVPYKVHQAKNGRIDPATEHPLYWLLSKKPNDFQSSFEFREQISLHLSLCQEAFVFKNIVRGNIVELIPYQPGVVTKVKHPDMTTSFKIKLSNGQEIAVPPHQMWHIKGRSWDGVEPIETIKIAREAIGLALAAEEHSARMFSNGARVGGVLTTDKTLNADQLKLLKQNWEETQGGQSNAYKTAVMFGGLTYSPMALDATDSQLIESRRHQVEEICRFMDILPIMVGYADKTVSYASAEAMFTAHVQYTLLPLYRRLEDSADVNLLGMNDIKAGFYTKFTAAGLLRGSIKDRGDFYTKMYNIGALCPDEIRAFEELNPYEGGDKYRVPLNMTDPANENPDDKPDDNKPDDDKGNK